MTSTQFLKLRKVILDAIQDNKFGDETYFSGSCVRDFYLKREVKKIEIIVHMYGGGIALAEYLTRRYGCYVAGKNPIINPRMGIAQFTLEKAFPELKDIVIEAAMTRKDQYTARTGFLPITCFGTMREDCYSRDFTIDSLVFKPKEKKFYDYTNTSFHDLKSKIIRTDVDPNASFKQDPYRMLRAIKLASELGFGIEKYTWLGICKNASLICDLSFDRLREGLNEILLSDHADEAFRRLSNSGLLTYILPEIALLRGIEQGSHHCEDAFEHSLSVMSKMPKKIEYRLAGLYHDVSKTETRSVDYYGKVRFNKHEINGAHSIPIYLRYLDYPNNVAENVAEAVRLHMRFKDIKGVPSKHSIRKFLKECSEHNLDLALSLIDADNKSRAEKHCKPEQVTKIREMIVKMEKDKEEKEIKIPIDGKDIMKKFGFKKGPKIGKAIKLVKNYLSISPQMTVNEAYSIIEDAINKNQI